MIRWLCGALCSLSLLGCGEHNAGLPSPGQWRIVNYWAIWCVPCREEIPELNAVHRDTALTVFAVNYDGQQGEALRAQADELGITFTLLKQDPGPDLDIERPRVLPTTLLVNPTGEVTDTLVGPQTRDTLLALWQQRTGIRADLQSDS